MKKLLLGLLLVIGVAMCGIEAKADTYYGNFKITQEVVWASVNAEYRYDEAYKLLDLVNEYRVANGRSALETNDTLMKIAMQRALESNIYFKHESPYGGSTNASVSVLGYIPANPTYNEAVKFSFNESQTISGGTLTAKGALQNFKDSKAHWDHLMQQSDFANAKQYAIGVGFVNDCAVICMFSKESAKTADSNTTLTNYKKTEKVPVLKSLVDNDSVETWDSRVKYNVSAPSGSDSSENNDSTEESKDTVEEQRKAVQAKKVVINSVSRKRSGRNNTQIIVKFKKISGMKYQVQYAFNKKFTSGKKTVTASSNKKTFTIKKKNNKTVYVRVRCYKKVNGKNCYGKWSSTKKVKTYKKR